MDEWYSHYVDVAWVFPKETDAGDIQFDQANPQWPVHDTLHVRPFHEYIKKIIL
jgi:hypothetical protein